MTTRVLLLDRKNCLTDLITWRRTHRKPKKSQCRWDVSNIRLICWRNQSWRWHCQTYYLALFEWFLHFSRQTRPVEGCSVKMAQILVRTPQKLRKILLRGVNSVIKFLLVLKNIAMSPRQAVFVRYVFQIVFKCLYDIFLDLNTSFEFLFEVVFNSFLEVFIPNFSR